MSICGKGTETFLYLNGIRPYKKLSLDDNVVLLPSSCNPTPDEIIAKSKNEVDLGIAILFLRAVGACLHIKAKNPRELAIKTWNAQWDAILFGALYDCEIGFNFQSDVTPDSFKNANDFHVTNYALKGLKRGKIKKMTSTENAWLKAHYKTAKRLMENDKYRNAIHCLASYRWHSMPTVQLAVLWSGIEGFFHVESELSFRISLYIAKYLSPKNYKKQKAIFKEIKKLYKERSKAVHGSKINDSEDVVKRSVKVLERLIKTSTEAGGLPVSNELCP